MSTCYTCKGTNVVAEGMREVKYTVGEVVFAAILKVTNLCTDCNGGAVHLKELIPFEVVVAYEVTLRTDIRNGRAFRLCRGVAKLSRPEFAARMGVDEAELKKAERDDAPIEDRLWDAVAIGMKTVYEALPEKPTVVVKPKT